MKETKLVSIIDKQKKILPQVPNPKTWTKDRPAASPPPPPRLKRIKTVTWFSCESDK